MITVGYSTRKSNPEYIDYIKKTCSHKDIEVIEIINQGDKSLSKVYNEIINKAKNDIIVLCHDDLEFDTKKWGDKIIKHFNDSDFGILGVAGTTEIPETGMWWQDRRKMMGIVNHKRDGKKWESKYSKSWGDKITECCFVDGLFIAINRKKIKENFDENVNGFHFYDVYFSVKNFLKNVKIGVVYNIRITHLSIGETNENWDINKDIFVNEYKEKLPIKSKTNINYNIKDFIFLKKYQIKIIINSSDSVTQTKKMLDKITSFNLPKYTINLISNESNFEDLKYLETDNIKIFEGVFNELPKNLSILKWDDDFISESDDIIFFIDKNIDLVNNIFSSIGKIYHNEKANFGCAFTTSINDDSTIYGTEINFIKNEKNNQINLFLKNNGTIYNLLDGYKQTLIGNMCDVLVTTYPMLKNNDWFDIQYDTNLTFNDFAVKCFLKNKKIYVDTDSVTTQKSFNNNEKINSDLNKLLQLITTNKKSQNIIQIVNG